MHPSSLINLTKKANTYSPTLKPIQNILLPH
jgi:hypothetical protein